MENNSISSDLIRGHIDTIILKTLLDGDKNGLEICREVEDRTEGKYEIRQATLYSALKRLENSKHLKAYWGESDDTDKNGGRRRYFHLTESGKEFVEKNQQNWEFSRDVIDLLVTGEVSPKKTYREHLEEPQPEIAQEAEFSPATQSETESAFAEPPAENEKVIVFPSAQNKEPEPIFKPESASAFSFEPNQNYNYKDALNRLIHPEATRESTVVSDEETEAAEGYKSALSRLIRPETRDVKSEPDEIPDAFAEQEPAVQDVLFANQEEKEASLSDEPTYDEYLIPKHASRKLDFSDLFEKAEKDGIKIRISTPQKKKKPQGLLFFNKLNMAASLGVYLLVLLELLVLSLSAKHLQIDTTPYVVLMLVTLIFPAVMVALYFMAPAKTIEIPTNMRNTFLTAGIIIFNIILVVLAIVLLMNTDFSDMGQLIPRFITPCLLALDVLAFFGLQYLLIKSGKFETK